MNNIPIIFVHRNNSIYLKYTLKQARFFNPDTPIYLLGDESNNQYNFVNHLNVDNYFESAREFSKHYVHMSFTPQKFEQFCFERWFIILDFVKKHKIETFLCLDSDVLLFCKSNDIHDKYKNYNFTIRGNGGAGLNYFSSIKALEEFCEYTSNHYINPQYFNTLELNWAGYQDRKHGGVCDMLLFALFRADNQHKIGDCGIIENNTIFEYCLLDVVVNNEKIILKKLIPYLVKKDNYPLSLKAFHVNIDKDKIFRYYTGGGLLKERLKDYFKDLRDRYPLRTMLRKLLGK